MVPATAPPAARPAAVLTGRRTALPESQLQTLTTTHLTASRANMAATTQNSATMLVAALFALCPKRGVRPSPCRASPTPHVTDEEAGSTAPLVASEKRAWFRPTGRSFQVQSSRGRTPALSEPPPPDESTPIRIMLSPRRPPATFSAADSRSAETTSLPRRGSADDATGGTSCTWVRTARRGGKGVSQQRCCPTRKTIRAVDGVEAALAPAWQPQQLR